MIFVFDIILLMPNTILKSLYVFNKKLYLCCGKSMKIRNAIANNLRKSAIQTNKYMMYD